MSTDQPLTPRQLYEQLRYQMSARESTYGNCSTPDCDLPARRSETCALCLTLRLTRAGIADAGLLTEALTNSLIWITRVEDLLAEMEAQPS